MYSTNEIHQAVDPVELLHRCLEHAWQTICASYDVSAALPEMQVLFDGVDFSMPERAAEMVVVNMLTEVIECFGRFSPYYKMPARAFGLISLREAASPRTRWVLAPEALHQWQPILEPLAQAVHQNSTLIQAVLLVDGLMTKEPVEDPNIVASCGCRPPNYIRLPRSVLAKAEILCDRCHQAFIQVEAE